MYLLNRTHHYPHKKAHTKLTFLFLLAAQISPTLKLSQLRSKQDSITATTNAYNRTGGNDYVLKSKHFNDAT